MNLDGRLMRPRPGPTILLFGSLSVSFDAAALAQLCKNVVGTDDEHWILDVITELPQWWNTITNALQIQSVQAETGHRQLEDLKDAFQMGKPLETPFPLPNKILVPLVVVLQLTQYATFLARTTAEFDDRVDIFAASTRKTETLGFCTGLLSAFAVSSAGSKEQFAQYGAVAIRLGMLIGMVADMDAEQTDAKVAASKCVSMEWDSAKSHEEMLRILKEFPEVGNTLSQPHPRLTYQTSSNPFTPRPMSQSTTTAAGPQ